MQDQHGRTDILHLLQAKSMAKKVPDNLHSIRRIIEYTKYTKDSGFNESLDPELPTYVRTITLVVILLYISFIVSAALGWWWSKFNFNSFSNLVYLDVAI